MANKKKRTGARIASSTAAAPFRRRLAEIGRVMVVPPFCGRTLSARQAAHEVCVARFRVRFREWLMIDLKEHGLVGAGQKKTPRTLTRREAVVAEFVMPVTSVTNAFVVSNRHIVKAASDFFFRDGQFGHCGRIGFRPRPNGRGGAWPPLEASVKFPWQRAPIPLGRPRMDVLSIPDSTAP